MRKIICMSVLPAGVAIGQSSAGGALRCRYPRRGFSNFDHRRSGSGTAIGYLALPLLVLVALPAYAQSPQLELGEITVTATRSERELDLTSKSVSVITSEEIAARTPRNVQELLAGVPGVSLSRAGGLGGQIVLRGFNSNDPRTLLLIDGDRFRGRNTLEYNLVDPSRIQRIEVIRGPASTLYGPDALAGVVNIITRRAEGDVTQPFGLTPRLRALEYQSINDLFGGRVELEGVGNGVDVLLGINARTAGDYGTPRGEIANSDFETKSADLRLGYTPSAGHRFELSAKYATVEAGRAGGINGAPAPPLVSRRDDPLIERLIKLSYDGANPGLGFASVGASLYARELYTGIEIEDRTVANRLTQVNNIVDGPLVVGGKLFGTLPWGDSLLTVGADFFHEDRAGTLASTRTTNFNADGSIATFAQTPRAATGPDSKQTDVGVFVHNDWDPSPVWTLSTGARVDHIRTTSDAEPVPIPQLRPQFAGGIENTETPVTGGVGVVYRPLETVHFTGNVSTAFRAPATFESFGFSRQGTGFLVPNAGLESERGTTYEIGARLRLPALSANLTGFHSDYKDLIAARPIIFLGLPSSQRQNIGEADIDGVELDATWRFARNWEAYGNAAYLRGTNSTTDAPLAYIPPLNGRLAVRRYFDGFYLEGVGRWSVRKDRIDPAQERETAGFGVLDLYAGFDLWKLSPRLPEMRLLVGVENVFDRTYRQPTTVEDVRFPPSNANPLLEPGRGVSIALRSRF